MKNIFTKTFTLILFSLISTLNLYSQSTGREIDKEIYDRVTTLLRLEEHANKPINERLILAAQARLESPYVAGTLEQMPESLVINIHETDCILFVESCLALVLNAATENPTFDNFSKQIQALRYRDGIIDGYTSRIHYTSEWIVQGEGNGYFKEITKELGGVKSNQKFSFMSEHPDSYKQLKGNQVEIDKIAAVEAELNSTDEYYVIPKESVPAMLSKLQSGDIIGFNTSVKGLDIAHIAYVYKNGDKISFLHASMGAMKVIVEPGDITAYINRIKSNNGIRIIRVNETK